MDTKPSQPDHDSAGAQEVTAHIRVEGRVQGVGFRYFVLECAQTLRVRGWVRNRWDESVEIVAQGDRRLLERFADLVQRGPRSAHVSRMTVDWLPAGREADTPQFIDFHIRPTD